MLVNQISNKEILKKALQSSFVWAICLALVESFQIVSRSSVRYLQPWDVVVIMTILVLAYFILWSIGLIIIAFILKYFREKLKLKKVNFIAILLCISLFIYNLFWIVYKIKSNNLYNSMGGIIHSFVLIIAAVLIAFAIYKIAETLIIKERLKNIWSKFFAFAFSALAYMVSNVYFKSITVQGNLSIYYSIALLLIFIIFFILMIFLIRKFDHILKFYNFYKNANRTKILISLFVSSSFLFYSAYYALSQTKDYSSKSSSRPNILLISIDTLRADHISIYKKIKKKTSPNIDKIAETGYVFGKNYSTASWTLPAHASMMTGLFPSSHGAHRSLIQVMSHPVDPLPSSVTTLAEILKNNGYHTAGIISNPFLSSTFGMNQGFQFYDDKIDILEDARFLYLNDSSMLFKILNVLKIIDKNDNDNERTAVEVNEKAIKWFEKNLNDTNPFFLFLHYNDPHFAYVPPWPYNKSDNGKPLDYFMDIERLNKGQFSLSSYGLKDMLTLYDGEISYVDYELGLLFKKLDQWHLLKDTLIIITSDHGESFNEHEVWQHGNRLYDDQILVPLIMRYPKLIPTGQIDVEHIVQPVDLMPTILDILQIPIPANIQGRSLLPIFQGKSDLKFNLAFSEIKPDINWKSKNPRYGYGMKSIILDDWKYIISDKGDEELYKLDVDPHEEQNLASIKRDKVNKMKTMLFSWSASVNHKKENMVGKINGGKLEQLRSLGYIK